MEGFDMGVVLVLTPGFKNFICIKGFTLLA
jgi:hypothetical protein